MIQYLAGRVLQYGIVLFLAVTVNFVLPRAMPGDPLPLLLGDDVALLPEETIQSALEKYGLDRPLPEQYLRYLLNLAQGDLGYSYHWKQPVAELLLDRLPWTLLLVGTAIVFSTILGVAAGIMAAWRRRKLADVSSLTLFMSLDAMPVFWLGMILIVLFVVKWRLFPLFGAVSWDGPESGPGYVLDLLHHLALPVITLTLVSTGGMFLITRYAMLAVIGEEYITTARAKGLRERRVILLHALRNAALPITTAVLLRLGHITGGSILVESVFTYPGLGRLLYQGVLSRDYPVVQGTFFLLTLTVVAANLLSDLLYPLLDPRVKYDGRGV